MVKLLKIRNVVADGFSKFLVGKEEGASLVEYALLVALIAAACIITLGLLGTEINAKFQEVIAALK